MYTFILSIVLLLLGYLVYSKVIARLLGVDAQRATPATTMADGVDYVPMKPWRVFLIQFLNIAGVGPICGAIMGAQFGSASFLWIVFGSIFAGAVHDFVAGFISLRNNGCSLPEIHGKYLGKGVQQFMRIFTILLMLLVGAVFVNTPAVLINGNFTPDWNIFIWVGVIFAYYLIATLLPIDKVIGKIYPAFGILLLAMAVAIMIAFFLPHEGSHIHLPEIWEGLENRHPQSETNPIFPMMFISIACGAISGFHATQSPLMARCLINEKQARPIFYGAMITEGIVALIWAAAAAYFFHDQPELCAGQSGNSMVGVIANKWFNPVIATITILGVISAAVTSGDTALRSARLIVADVLKYDQKPIKNRLLVAAPVFTIAAGILIYSLLDKNGFQLIWRYFAWSNQILATVTLWAITVYLRKKNRKKAYYLITLLPALFMTMVVSSFIFVAYEGGLGSMIPNWMGYSIGGIITAGTYVIFAIWKIKSSKKESDAEE